GVDREQAVVAVVRGDDVGQDKTIHADQDDAVGPEALNGDVAEYKVAAGRGDRDAVERPAGVHERDAAAAVQSDQRDLWFGDGDRSPIDSWLNVDLASRRRRIDGRLNRLSGMNQQVSMSRTARYGPVFQPLDPQRRSPARTARFVSPGEVRRKRRH